MSGIFPMIFILGSTGTGKTKLSLELAKKFGGEIIGADSMQIYKGLDIITAKATKEEQSLAPHHLINILEPHESFTVVGYRNMALDIIKRIIDKKKMPIIVGGTNYYIESLIWKVLVDSENSEWKYNPGELPNNEHELPSLELHNKLKVVDPETAERLHPNNKRKIIRALEVYLQNGKKLSEILKEQQTIGSKCGEGLRFSNALVFWLHCDQKVLDKRLDERVDLMMQLGLVDELTNFYNLYNKHCTKTDKTLEYTKGIFQSIGFKEFHDYLTLNETERGSPEGKKKLDEGINLLKIATRQYARKQTRWTVNRFLGRIERKAPPIYAFDTTDVSSWTQNVEDLAIRIIESYVSGSECDILPLKPRETNSTSNLEDTTYVCEVCDKVFVGKHQWQQHTKSNRHKKVQAKKRKLNL